MTQVTLRYWAAAKAAAGVGEETLEAATLAEAIAAAGERHGAGLQRVLGICSFVVDEVPSGRADPATVPLRPGSEVDVLPPFAGGAGAWTGA